MWHPLMWDKILKLNQSAHHINYLCLVKYMHGEEKSNKLFNVIIYKPKLWKYTMKCLFFYQQTYNKINYGFGLRCKCFCDKRIFFKIYAGITNRVNQKGPSQLTWISSSQGDEGIQRYAHSLVLCDWFLSEYGVHLYTVGRTRIKRGLISLLSNLTHFPVIFVLKMQRVYFGRWFTVYGPKTHSLSFTWTWKIL